MSDLREYALNGKTILPDELLALMKDRAQYFHDSYISPLDLALDPNSETALIHKSRLNQIQVDRLKPLQEQPDPPPSESEAFYPLQKFAIRQLCMKLKIPVDFFLRCRRTKVDGGRLDAHFNTWTERHGGIWFVRFDSYSGRDEIRSVLSKRFEDVTNVEIAEFILQYLPNKFDYKIRFEWRPEAIYGQIVSDKVTRKLGNGQEIKGGIRFKNSEVGLGSIALEMFVLCEAIKTGPILPGYVGLRRTHLQKKDDLKEEFRKTVENLVGNMDSALDLVAATETIRLQDPQGFLETIFLRHRLEIGQQEAVKEALQTYPLRTMFDAITIFSIAGTDPGMSVEKREKLQRVSGSLAQNVSKYGAWIAPEKLPGQG
jgi:hypothetical protein